MKKNISIFPFSQMKLKNYFYEFITVLFMIIFYSCSTTEFESLNNKENTEAKKESVQNKTLDKSETAILDYDIENVNSLSQQIFASVETIEVALNKNNSVAFNNEAKQLVNTATNENDLKFAFEKAGIANSQEVIDLLKIMVTAQQDFISNNPSFYNLPIETRIEVLNASIESTQSSYIWNTPLPNILGQAVPNDKCGRLLTRNWSRCNRAFGACAVSAIAGAAAGIWPGLIGAAVCMYSKYDCQKNAQEDYTECLLESADLPPATGELTLHCTVSDPLATTAADSCWTTDSNGKYVGRID